LVNKILELSELVKFKIKNRQDSNLSDIMRLIGFLIKGARDKAGYNTFRSLIKEIGGWPLIDDNWDGSKYDLVNALIVFHRKIAFKSLLGISVEPYIFDNTKTLINVSFNDHIILNYMILTTFAKD